MARKKPYCIWCHRDLLSSQAVDRAGKPHPLAFTRDHLVPRAMGGERWYPCCRACNQVKADLAPGEWDTFRAENPRWWALFPRYTARTWGRRINAGLGN